MDRSLKQILRKRQGPVVVNGEMSHLLMVIADGKHKNIAKVVRDWLVADSKKKT